jgi:hypothetical protein
MSSLWFAYVLYAHALQLHTCIDHVHVNGRHGRGERRTAHWTHLNTVPILPRDMYTHSHYCRTECLLQFSTTLAHENIYSK